MPRDPNIKDEKASSDAPEIPEPPQAVKKELDGLQALREQMPSSQLTPTARRAIAAGLVSPRPETGPSVPLNQVCAQSTSTHVKSEHAILGDTSVPQSRKKRSVSQAGQLVSVKHEDQQDTAQLPAKKHKGGKATAASQKQKQLKKARGYLAERGIFAGAYMSAHSKTGILRGVSTCAVGGWSILLDKLVAGEVPKACAVCVDFLASKQLDIRGLMDHIEDVPGVPGCDAGAAVASASKQEGQNALVKQELEEAPDTGDVVPLQDEGTSAAGEEVDARALVLANPHLRLLPDGWGKKRTPVECLVCRRKSTGKLAVFDLSSAGGRKSYDQHVTGPTHVKNVALARSGAQTFQSSKSARHAGSAIVVREPCEPGEHEGYESDGHQPSEPVALRCQGLHVQQAPKGAKVAKLLPAFELWVGYNVRSSAINLHAEDERHAYLHDLSTGHYIITHHSCQKDAASIVETDVPPLCDKCMSLAKAGAHGAALLFEALRCPSVSCQAV